MNATINLENKHFPVLLNELISIISPLYGGTFIDCTFGQGNYSKKILENIQNKIIAIDRDKEVFSFAEKLKNKVGKRFIFKNLKFSQINKIKINEEKLRGIVFDLGYSSIQINNPNKGLSFRNNCKLNMKMGLNNLSADEVVNQFNESSMIKIFKFFGDEKKAKQIAKKIIIERKKKNLETQDLVKIIESVKKYKKSKIHNATKVFQSLRIFVNEEISELINGLINAFNLLPVGGMIVVVTFNSLEDKIVKFFFKHYSEIKNSSRYIPEKIDKFKCFKLHKKKPITATLHELNLNPSSRSAKLRYATKISNNCNFKDFIEKFAHLKKIEELKFER